MWISSEPAKGVHLKRERLFYENAGPGVRRQGFLWKTDFRSASSPLPMD